MKQPQLGQKIITLRKEKGLTQEELVEMCNINVRTLQRIESGEVNPRGFTLKMIFKALEYEINAKTPDKKNSITTYLETLIFKLNEQIQIITQMKNSKIFFYNFFLAIGIVWFLCALSILIFKLNFGPIEISLTIIIPLSFAIFKQISNPVPQVADKKSL